MHAVIDDTNSSQFLNGAFWANAFFVTSHITQINRRMRHLTLTFKVLPESVSARYDFPRETTFMCLLAYRFFQTFQI